MRRVSMSRVLDIMFWVLLVAGFVLRMIVVFSNAYNLDGDNAIVYLISKHISEGRFEWFFWGQPYGGTLLQFVAGGAMVVFGQHVEVLAVVSSLFFVGVVLVLRFITRTAVGPDTANIAAILFWFAGAYILRVSVSEPGFYGPSMLLGLGAVALALRPRPGNRWVQWVLVGLCAGLALWQSPMGATLAFPGVVILAVRDRNVLRYLVGLAAAVVGALPWLIAYGTSLSAITPKETGVRPSYRGFLTMFSVSIPSLFSATGDLAGVISVVVCGLLLLLAVYLVIRHRSLLLVAVLLGAGITTVVIVVGAGAVLGTTDNRYTIFILPALLIPLAWLLTRVRIVGAVAMVLAAVLTFVQIKSITPDLRIDTSSHYGVGDIAGLGDYLEAHGIKHAWGDYWLAYAVSAETNEAATVASVSIPLRYKPYETLASQQSPVTVIVFKGLENDTKVGAGGVLPYTQRTEVGDYAIYTFAAGFDPLTYPWALY